MELVKGVPLMQFCDDRQVSVVERLKIFQQICHAVQHAHQKGIIHRDLKPSNILVESHDGRPVSKVIDFGLAKAMNAMPLTDRSLFTNYGAVLGTPLYMAPEQAEFSAIDVDTRADVYALGVILYELLTGTTPVEKKRFAKAAWDEIRRVIKEEEPQTPSPTERERRPRLHRGAAADGAEKARQAGARDLDWIVMKALAKERDRRYETANAFAADVERFLNDEPVSAGPPTLGYKFRKFVSSQPRSGHGRGRFIVDPVGGRDGQHLAGDSGDAGRKQRVGRAREGGQRLDRRGTEPRGSGRATAEGRNAGRQPGGGHRPQVLRGRPSPAWPAPSGPNAADHSRTRQGTARMHGAEHPCRDNKSARSGRWTTMAGP